MNVGQQYLNYRKLNVKYSKNSGHHRSKLLIVFKFRILSSNLEKQISIKTIFVAR